MPDNDNDLSNTRDRTAVRKKMEMEKATEVAFLNKI